MSGLVLRMPKATLLFGLLVSLIMPLVAQAQPEAEITVELPGGARIDFVWVEPGSFTMGTRQADADQLAQVQMWRGDGGNQFPAHNVTLTKGFYIGKFELTQQQWLSVMGELPPKVNETPIELDHPVYPVSWDAAQTFVWTLNQTVGDSLYRLPTEAEWEYACRAGTQTLWSFGVEAEQMKRSEYPLLAEYAWTGVNSCVFADECDCFRCDVKPVGTKPANPWGLYDMHGNVAEWVSDGPRTYTTDPVVDPIGPIVGRERIRRGGTVVRSPFDLTFEMQSTSAFRYVTINNISHTYSGMRLVLLEAPINRHPRADAGPDQFGDPGQTFTLDGNASRDPNGMPLSFEWRESAENPVHGLVQDPHSAAITVTLPEYGTYRFELLVSDGLDVVSDLVEILIPPEPAQPRDAVLTLELRGGESMDFVWIEPGTFTMGFTPEQEAILMGSKKPWPEDHIRPHSVTITHGFYMATHEITRRHWVSLMGTRPWDVDKNSYENDERPATRLSWNDVQTFIEIQNGAIGAEVFRLPTEAEWEYAFRAGTTTIWPFGDDPRLREKYGNRGLRSVTEKPPNPWGLYGMIGNASEWCHDSFRPFDGSHVVDPVGEGSDRKILAGSFTGRERRHYPELTFTNSISGARLIVWGPKLSTSVKEESWGRIKKAFHRNSGGR